jgi:hypothetical protein
MKIGSVTVIFKGVNAFHSCFTYVLNDMDIITCKAFMQCRCPVTSFVNIIEVKAVLYVRA